MIIAVVAHHSRRERAERLAKAVGATAGFVDDADRGPAWGHIQALEAAAGTGGHLVVVEDDALPCVEFAHQVGDWIARYPDDMISYYLGKIRPPQHQTRIQTRLAAADRRGEDHIKMRTLLHGVAYSLPCSKIGDLLPLLESSSLAIDERIGRAWRATQHRQVIYPIPSLVDHDDSTGSLVAKRAPGRRAWRPPLEFAELG